jgi:hypothetical protein
LTNWESSEDLAWTAYLTALGTTGTAGTRTSEPPDVEIEAIEPFEGLQVGQRQQRVDDLEAARETEYAIQLNVRLARVNARIARLERDIASLQLYRQQVAAGTTIYVMVTYVTGQVPLFTQQQNEFILAGLAHIDDVDNRLSDMQYRKTVLQEDAIDLQEAIDALSPIV